MPAESDNSSRANDSGLRVLPSDPAPAPKVAKPPSRYGAGDRIADKYRLAKRLGEGGMGEVWRAHNDTLDIDVAIKLIRGEIATSDMADRLLHEARAAARLGHPAIVRINDFGKTALGDPYIVMELLDGEDLAGALQSRGRLSAIKAIRTLLPIVHALTVAHTKGIVHRDLKPENIFLARTDDGAIQPKLVDFGVAKLELPQTHRITQSGALLGSPLYMSPEQARGDDVDHRADVWALGVVLYEAITGRPPFEGKNYNAIIYSIIANPATPITEFGAGDDELWTVIDRALQKDPDRRWYSMRDLGEALARWLVDRSIHEDITGTSLQTTWFSSHQERDALRAPSVAPGPDTTRPLPPVPTLAAGFAETRATRSPRRSPIVAVSLGAGLVALGLTVALVTSRRSARQDASASTAASRTNEAPPPARVEPSKTTPTATESTTATESATAPPPSAKAVEPPKRKPAASHTAQHAAGAKSSRGPRALKDPFQ